ncbi:MAG: C4-type zinc ribbon domain-containing protein [Candidatus Omnitrophota bacterium]
MVLFDRLRDLQNLDLVIFQLTQRMHRIPKEIADLEAELKKQEERLAVLEKETKKEQVLQKETELELAVGEEEIRKCQKRLMEVKTNKEYSVVLAEIERAKKAISDQEEKALLLMDKISGMKNAYKEEEKKVTQDKSLLETKRKVLIEEEAETKFRLEEEEKKRPVLSGSVSKEILSIYERILPTKANRKALAGVANGNCSGCHFRIPTVTMDKLHKGNETVFCDGCSRILYLE